MRSFNVMTVMNEALLRAVVKIANHSPALLVGGGHDPRPGRGQLRPRLDVRDRRGNQLRELREPILDLVGQGRPGGTPAPITPQSSPSTTIAAPVPERIPVVADASGIAPQSRRSPRFSGMPIAGCIAAAMGSSTGQLCRPERDAVDRSRRQARSRCDRIRRRQITTSARSSTWATSLAIAANTSGRRPRQRPAPRSAAARLRATRDRVVLAQRPSARRRSSMSVNATTAPRPSGISIGAETYETGNIEPSRRNNQSRSVGDRLARGTRPQQRAVGGGIRGPIGMPIVDRRVAGAPEQPVRSVISERRRRGRIGEPDQILRVHNQDRLRTVSSTARELFGATAGHPRSIGGPDTRRVRAQSSLHPDSCCEARPSAVAGGRVLVGDLDPACGEGRQRGAVLVGPPTRRAQQKGADPERVGAHKRRRRRICGDKLAGAVDLCLGTGIPIAPPASCMASFANPAGTSQTSSIATGIWPPSTPSTEALRVIQVERNAGLNVGAGSSARLVTGECSRDTAGPRPGRGSSCPRSSRDRRRCRHRPRDHRHRSLWSCHTV